MSAPSGGLSIRARLAWLNAAVFVVGGGVLLCMFWFSVREITGANSGLVTAVRQATP